MEDDRSAYLDAYEQDYYFNDPDLKRAALRTYFDTVLCKTPVTVEKCQNRHPVTVLADILTQIPPRDLRSWDSDPLDDFDKDISEIYGSTLMESMKVIIAKKLIGKGEVISDVIALSNVEEFLRYNEAVHKFNLSNRKIRAIFDPLTGQTTYPHRRVSSADPAKILPENLVRGMDGVFEEKHPEYKYRLLCTVHYKIHVTDDSFYVTFVARDPYGHILYQNNLRHKDLSAIIRRAYQEMFGYPYTTYKNSKRELPLAHGISMLLKGDKNKFVRNKSPLVENNEQLKTAYVEKSTVVAKQSVSLFFEPILGWIIPIACIPTILWIVFFKVLPEFDAESASFGNSAGAWFWGGIGLCIFLASFCPWLAGKLRKARLDMTDRSRF